MPGQPKLNTNRTVKLLNKKAPIPPSSGGTAAGVPQTQVLKSRHVLPKQAKSTRFDSTERGETKLPNIFRDSTQQKIITTVTKKQSSMHDVLKSSSHQKPTSSTVQFRKNIISTMKEGVGGPTTTTANSTSQTRPVNSSTGGLQEGRG